MRAGTGVVSQLSRADRQTEPTVLEPRPTHAAIIAILRQNKTIATFARSRRPWDPPQIMKGAAMIDTRLQDLHVVDHGEEELLYRYETAKPVPFAEGVAVVCVALIGVGLLSLVAIVIYPVAVVPDSSHLLRRALERSTVFAAWRCSLCATVRNRIGGASRCFTPSVASISVLHVRRRIRFVCRRWVQSRCHDLRSSRKERVYSIESASDNAIWRLPEGDEGRSAPDSACALVLSLMNVRSCERRW